MPQENLHAAEVQRPVGHRPSPALLTAQVAAYLTALLASYLVLWAVWPNTKSVEAAKRTLELADVTRPVLFFGDRSVDFSEEGETDQRGIRAMLNDILSQPDVGSAANSGFTLPLFRDMFTLLERPESQVQTAIICINLGFLSPAWYMRPDPFYCQSRYFLRHNGAVAQAFYRPLVAFRAVSPISYSQTDRDRTLLVYESRPFGSVGDLERLLDRIKDTPEADRAATIAIYMQPCTSDNPSLRALVDLVRKCRRAGIRTVPYISPINVQHGERILGPAFRDQVDRNLETICQMLASEGAEPVNLAFDLPHDVFEKRHPMSTHLIATGRMYVARRLRDAIEPAPDRTDDKSSDSVVSARS